MTSVGQGTARTPPVFPFHRNGDNPTHQNYNRLRPTMHSCEEGGPRLCGPSPGLFRFSMCGRMGYRQQAWQLPHQLAEDSNLLPCDELCFSLRCQFTRYLRRSQGQKTQTFTTLRCPSLRTDLVWHSLGRVVHPHHFYCRWSRNKVLRICSNGFFY